MKTVEARGVGIFRGIENKKVTHFSTAKNRAYGKIAFNWNMSGTRDFQMR
jgi:hypothetical protein